MVRPDRWCFGWRPRGRRATTTARWRRAPRRLNFELVGGRGWRTVGSRRDGGGVGKAEAELADRRRLRAEKLASQTEKAREMSAARCHSALSVAAGRENIKTFVPRYKRGSGGAGADLKLDPSLRASTTSRRMKDGAMAVGIARRRPPRANAGGRQRRGDGQDAKIQQALNDKIRQARQLQESNETYDYDRNEFDRQSFLLTHEKFDVRRILEKPRLGSDSPR